MRNKPGCSSENFSTAVLRTFIWKFAAGTNTDIHTQAHLHVQKTIQIHLGTTCLQQSLELANTRFCVERVSSLICWVDFCSGRSRTSPWWAQWSPKHGRICFCKKKIRSCVHVRAELAHQVDDSNGPSCLPPDTNHARKTRHRTVAHVGEEDRWRWRKSGEEERPRD